MSYPLCEAPEHWLHQILKGGRRLLCANLPDPVPAGAARGRGPAVAATPSLWAGHGPLRVARGCGPTVAAALGM